MAPVALAVEWRRTLSSFIRRRTKDALEKISMERDVCNLTSKYSPEYVRNSVLRGPKDWIAIGVSGEEDAARI